MVYKISYCNVDCVVSNCRYEHMAFNNIYIFLMKEYLLGEVRILTKLKIRVLFQLHFFSLQNSGYSLLTFQIIIITVEGACALFRVASKMVHVCCVPCCSSRSDRERNLSYFGLPFQDKKLLKQWIHRIGRANLPLNRSTRICSRHFIKAEGRKLCQDEVPSENLPVLSTQLSDAKHPKEAAKGAHTRDNTH